MNWDNIKYMFQIPLEWFQGIHARVYKMFGTNFLTVREDESGGTELGIDEQTFEQMVHQYAPQGGVQTVNNKLPDANGNVDLGKIVNSVNNHQPDANGNVVVPIGGVDTVNGIGPDQNGNVNLGDIVHTVNSTQPDQYGNVDLGTLVNTVNGQSPDQTGNVQLTGFVKTVNSTSPDAVGDVDLGDIVYSVNNAVPDANGNVQLAVVESVNGVAPDANGDVDLGDLVHTVDGISPDTNGDIDFGLAANKWMKTAADGSIGTTDEIPAAVSAGLSGYLYSDGTQVQVKNEHYVDLSTAQTANGEKTWGDRANFYGIVSVKKELGAGNINIEYDSNNMASITMLGGAGGTVISMSQTGSNVDTYLTKTAAYGFRAHDDTGITLDSAANKVVLENSPTSSAPDKAVATVGWCKDTLLSGYTNSTGLNIVTDVTWNGTTLQMKRRLFKFKGGLVDSVGNETTSTIDTPVTY